MFRLLGLHDGPDITVQAAAALAGCAVERCGQLIASLQGAHLVEESSAGRFRLHDLMHLLARDRSDEEDTAAQRFAAVARVGSWYLHSACAARGALAPLLPPMHPPAPVTPVPPAGFADHGDALSWCDRERANMVAASAAAARYQDFQVAWQLPTALYAYFDLCKHYDDWIHTHRDAAQAARLLGDAEAEGRVLCNLGNAYRPLCRFDEATACYSRALELFLDAGYRQGEAKVLGNLASTYHESGRADEAVVTHEAAIALFNELGDRHGQALSWANLGRVRATTGCYALAEQCQRRAIALFSELGDEHGKARATANLGAVELMLGRLGSAVDLLTKASSEFIALGDRFEGAATLVDLAGAHTARGEYADARRSLRRAHDAYRDIGDSRQHEIASWLMSLGSG